jgi:hypothetical protein
MAGGIWGIVIIIPFAVVEGDTGCINEQAEIAPSMDPAIRKNNVWSDGIPG